MNKYLLIPAFFLFAGCGVNTLNMSNSSNTNSHICQTEPSWVLNPPVEKGVVYGIGIAPANFNGIQAQRKSAIAKAINEIATQLKTNVNSQIVTRASIHNKSATTSMDSVSFQTVNGQTVSAKIVKSCKTPSGNFLYILMKANK